MAALTQRGDFAFWEPIAITRDRIVIDGYARWELAKRVGREALRCIQYDLSPDEALGELLRTHHHARGLPDFVRIELALDLEPYFRDKALTNQQVGGKEKALSKMTIDQRVDTQREVAQVAGVCSGNVRKVKHILANACPNLLQAARTEEISINLADKWSHEPQAEQQEHIRLLRIERGLKRKARRLIAAQTKRASPAGQDRRAMKLSNLLELVNQFRASTRDQTVDVLSIEVEAVDAPGLFVFATQELINFLEALQGTLTR